ncbi:MAG: hypothetical protein LC126_17915 [Bryobacterales bacterium]|nr:hypothetical protein [Bryobacterales bacterium]
MYLITILALAFSLWFVHWLTDPKRHPLTLSAARLLRRAGRWFWAAGEAVEIGYFHKRQVRDRIQLELEAGKRP